jgi:hypothetical protein
LIGRSWVKQPAGFGEQSPNLQNPLRHRLIDWIPARGIVGNARDHTPDRGCQAVGTVTRPGFNLRRHIICIGESSVDHVKNRRKREHLAARRAIV